MRVLLSRLLPVGGLPVVLALFINHCRLNFDLIIKCVSRATMDDEVLIMSSFLFVSQLAGIEVQLSHIYAHKRRHLAIQLTINHNFFLKADKRFIYEINQLGNQSILFERVNIVYNALIYHHSCYFPVGQVEVVLLWVQQSFYCELLKLTYSFASILYGKLT